MRTGVVAGVVVLAYAVFAAAAATARSAGTEMLAYTAMERVFARPAGLYADADLPYARTWPLSQALAATIAHGSAPQVRSIVRALDAHYRDGIAYDSSVRPPLGRGRAPYYDDNEWLGLDFVDAYRLLGDRTLLAHAQQIFRFVTSGWDGNAADPCAGGVYWARSAKVRARNTVSTANGAVLALELYAETHERGYLVWGQRMYDWVSLCLTAPDGLLFDHLDGSGQIARDTWTYNQGAMIAAGTLLAGATGDSRYLDGAERLARTALAHYDRSGYAGEPPVFVAIFFRDLCTLHRVRPSPMYRRELLKYLSTHARPRANGRLGWSLLDQAAAVQLYAASVSWKAASSSRSESPNASTTIGSNWRPDSATISSRASAHPSARR